ncbi:ligT like phosphoesterase [bacterium]|nr:ligT like phosphoesterase [bacterium]
MESYQQFLERINQFETAELNLGSGPFEVSRSLAAKVGSDNKFKPFFGDTSVFDLDDGAKDYLDGLISRLYSECGECFCERLDRDYLHMTLHDLSSSPDFADVKDTLRKRGEYFAVNPLRDKTVDFSRPIVMRANNILNMVNISLVLGLYPAGDDDYRRLCALYAELEKIVGLPYAMTPHITLAYYNCRSFGAESADRLKKTVKEMNLLQGVKELIMRPEKLFYEHFFSMNNYKKIQPLIKL